MIASLLQNTKRSALDHAITLGRITTNITSDKHILLVFEEASSLLLQGPNEKTQGFFVLCSLLTHEVTCIEGRLCALIDRLPTLLLHASDTDTDYICTLITSFTQREVFYHRLEKQLPRLVQTLLHQMEESRVAYPILQAILQHFGKATVMSAHGNKLQRALLPLVLQPIHAPQASRALASMYFYSNTDMWNITWNRHVNDFLYSLHLLSLQQSMASEVYSYSEQLAGYKSIARVLFLERAVKASCLTLMQMLSVGCSSGAVVTDYTRLIGALKSVLSYHMEIVDDNKNLIENEAGISPAALGLVIPNIKMYAWSLFAAMLESQHMANKRFSYDLCKCLASSFALPGAIKVDGLALVAFEMAIVNFPLTMTQVASNCIEIVISQLEEVVEVITTHDSDSAPLASSVLSAVTILLQHASPLLPVNMRTQIEIAFSRMLLCLLRGCLVMRGKRTAELLRIDAQLQIAVFRSAAAESQALGKDGVISGNIGLFRRAAYVYAGQFRSEVLSLLAGVDAMLHPAAVCIASTNIPQVVQQAILKRKRDSDEVESGHGMSLFAESAVMQDVVPASSITTTSTTTASAVTVPPAKPNHEVSAAVKNFQYSEVKTQKTTISKAEESDDDFDFPEINIDAKPDQK